MKKLLAAGLIALTAVSAAAPAMARTGWTRGRCTMGAGFMSTHQFFKHCKGWASGTMMIPRGHKHGGKMLGDVYGWHHDWGSNVGFGSHYVWIPGAEVEASNQGHDHCYKKSKNKHPHPRRSSLTCAK